VNTVAKLTIHDRDLIHELRNERNKHIANRDRYLKLSELENTKAMTLNNSAIAIKFDVAESTIRRVLSNNV
jgi:hypothetical protein